MQDVCLRIAANCKCALLFCAPMSCARRLDELDMDLNVQPGVKAAGSQGFV